MPYTFVLSPSAKQDLQDIMWYKAEYDPDYAIAFVDKLVDRFKQTLSTFPRSGTFHNKQKNIRKITFEGYTTFYRVTEALETIDVLRIVGQGKPLEARGIDFS